MKALLLITMLLSASTSFAGVDGGGGQGVLCDSGLMSLDLSEVLDDGLRIAPSTGTLTGDLRKFGPLYVKYTSTSGNITNDTKYLADAWELKLRESVLSKFENIRPGASLPLTQDSTVKGLKPGCRLVQILIYNDKTDVILRDEKLWKQLNPIDQAALAVHEFIYHRARSDGGALDSDEVRKVVGALFSTTPPAPAHAPLWSSDKSLQCSARTGTDESSMFEPDFNMFNFKVINEIRNEVSGVAIYFETIKSSFRISKTTVFFPGLTLDTLMDGKVKVLTGVVSNAFSNRIWDFQMQMQLPTAKGFFPILVKAQGNLDLTEALLSTGLCQLRNNQ